MTCLCKHGHGFELGKGRWRIKQIGGNKLHSLGVISEGRGEEERGRGRAGSCAWEAAIEASPKWLRLLAQRCPTFALTVFALPRCNLPLLLLPVQSAPHELPGVSGAFASTEERTARTVGAEGVRNSRTLGGTHSMVTTHKLTMQSSEHAVTSTRRKPCGQRWVVWASIEHAIASSERLFKF